MLEPATRSVFRDQAVDRLREAIADGRLKMGQPIRERRVAEDLRISRAPIREALRQLEQEGLVVTHPHRGSFVATYTDEDIQEIYSLRAALEVLAIGRAIGRAGAADLDRLEGGIAEMERLVAGGDFTDLIRVDLAFHRAICELAAHRRLLATWNHLAYQILAIYTITDVPRLVRRLYGYVEQIGDRHRPILEAIRDRDAEAGRRYLATHVLEVAAIIAEQRVAAPGVAPGGSPAPQQTERPLP